MGRRSFLEKLPVLLTEAFSIRSFEKIKFNFIDLKSSNPEVTQEKKLRYKLTATFSFVYNVKDKDNIKITELKDKVLENVIKSPTFQKELEDYVYSGTIFFDHIVNERDLIKVDVIYNTFRNFHYNEMQDLYYGEVDFEMVYDLPEWFARSIIKAQTSKSFFFKNYKIKYEWSLNYLIRNKTSNWKDLCIQAIRYAIFNKTKLKDFMERLTRLTIDPQKVDFEISLNATRNEIKLIVVKGIVKWLKKFGIPAKYSKYILLGLTIFGVLAIIKKKEPKELYKDIKKEIEKFL